MFARYLGRRGLEQEELPSVAVLHHGDISVVSSKYTVAMCDL